MNGEKTRAGRFGSQLRRAQPAARRIEAGNINSLALATGVRADVNEEFFRVARRRRCGGALMGCESKENREHTGECHSEMAEDFHAGIELSRPRRGKHLQSGVLLARASRPRVGCTIRAGAGLCYGGGAGRQSTQTRAQAIAGAGERCSNSRSIRSREPDPKRSNSVGTANAMVCLCSTL